MDHMRRGTESPFQKGEQVEQYHIVELLAPTRFGYLYLGQHRHQHLQVLIEVFLPPLLDIFKEDFLKSGQTVTRLEHPHILRMRDLGVYQYYPFSVADYLPYSIFRQVYAPQSAQPLKTLLPHLKQIASALHYVHSQHMSHGDVRPENILLSEDNTILLRGFLFKALLQNRTYLNYQGMEAAEQNALIYAAPEQMQGNASPASDQYALGVLIYKLLCGQAPFTGSIVEVAFQKMHAPVPSLRQKSPGVISPGIEQVVMRALEREPEKRFPDIQAFIDALEQGEQRRPGKFSAGVSALPVSVTAPPGLSSPRFPASPPAFSVFQEMAPLQATAPADGSPEPLEQRPQKPKKTKGKRSQSRRRESVSVGRRLFAVGLVGIAASGGAGGWYILSQRFARAALPAVFSQAGLPATQTITNKQKELIFTGHLASVNAISWSPDGKFITSASDDTFVQVFESATGKRRLIYKGHTEEVATVAWSSNGLLIASAGQDRTVQIWNAANGTLVFTYKGHTDRVNSVSWSSKGAYLASGSDDKSVQAWQASSGHRTFTFVGHTAGVLCVSWQPDVSSVASSSWDGTLRDWATVQHGDHFQAGEQIFKYGGHGENEVYALAWSPNGNFIASAGADQTVQISSGIDGTPRPPFFADHRRTDHINRALTLAWSPNGNFIASGDEDGNVYVWTVVGRRTVFRYTGHQGAVNAVSWSPDGKFIASAGADSTVHVWQPG